MCLNFVKLDFSRLFSLKMNKNSKLKHKNMNSTFGEHNMAILLIVSKRAFSFQLNCLNIEQISTNINSFSNA